MSQSPEPSTNRTTECLTDPRRLSALKRLHLLDSPADEAFDRISRLAARVLEVPIALVSLVDINRQFFKSCVGLPEPYSSWRETPLSASFCKHVVESGEPLILGDAREHLAHRDNDAIRELGAIAYLGCPLIVDGENIGSFCVIDTKPREWSDTDIGIVADLTQIVMTEIRLRARSNEHVAALEGRDRVLAVVSHDLRSPVQVILTSAAVLTLQDPDARQRSVIDGITRSATHMKRMIGDLLEASTLEFDRLSIETESLSIPGLLNEVQEYALPAADEKRIALVADAPPLPDIRADRERLTQAIMNLLDNAIRLTPAGGQIEMSARRGDGEVVIEIADSGPGIAESDLPKIFEFSWHTGRSASCPAASFSACSSRARWRSGRRCSCSTSRPRAWTRRVPAICTPCSASRVPR